jgi:hypothetical protein
MVKVMSHLIGSLVFIVTRGEVRLINRVRGQADLEWGGFVIKGSRKPRRFGNWGNWCCNINKLSIFYFE